MYLFLEFLTKAYRDACAEGEAETYRAHVAILGNCSTVKDNVIEGLLDGSRVLLSMYKGIKTTLIESKFNKATQRTERWRQSRRDSSQVMTELRHAVLRHIRSLQHVSKAKGEMETLQQTYSPAGEESERKKSIVYRYESIKNRKQSVTQNISHKLETCQKEAKGEITHHSSVAEESDQKQSTKNRKQDVKLETPEKVCAAQFNEIDNETLFFLHKNVESQEPPDKNIPYSINLRNFNNRDEFSAMNQLFLKPEALILYIVDTTLDFFSPFDQGWKINETSKTSAEILTYWLKSVHDHAEKQNFKPNIVLLLTHTYSFTETGRSQYVESYVQTIIKTVEGKPYADYISEENIIIVDNYEGLRNELFDRMLKQPSWGVKRPIKWLCLEAELLRRTTDEGQDKYESELFDYFGTEHTSSHYQRKPLVLISEVKELASACDMDDSEVESFLQFHHALGDFICCPPSKGERYFITDPEWFMERFAEMVSE